jgi:hypothetical protein
MAFWQQTGSYILRLLRRVKSFGREHSKVDYKHRLCSLERELPGKSHYKYYILKFRRILSKLIILCAALSAKSYVALRREVLTIAISEQIMRYHNTRTNLPLPRASALAAILLV